jgi:hypothetical protein
VSTRFHNCGPTARNASKAFGGPEETKSRRPLFKFPTKNLGIQYFFYPFMRHAGGFLWIPAGYKPMVEFELVIKDEAIRNQFTRPSSSLFACHNACHKNRFFLTPEGKSGLSDLLPGRGPDPASHGRGVFSIPFTVPETEKQCPIT